MVIHMFSKKCTSSNYKILSEAREGFFVDLWAPELILGWTVRTAVLP